ncbi:hypothetical protein SAMN02927914_04810 [Mesorhizobium qingshengii]|uniref:Uncharacterized protein n=2 Tax=Mesorhizobium qingshengii TaxID=1165689 RepID=A0A1G5ZE05_9HYPH|nr:hypothetical protein SAMN02927914_04810 [Mesorhizobium qingshengii]
MSRSGESISVPPGDFSLVLGGPLFQFLRRARLCDDAMQMLYRRVIFFVAICWLPLFLFSAFQGQLFGGGVAVPFLADVDLHVRFLLSMPLLVLAELVVHRRMRLLVSEFRERHLISNIDLPRFETAVKSASRFRDSIIAEVLLIAMVYAVGIAVIWRHYTALDAVTWYAGTSNGESKLSAAGLWFVFVSLPVFQFLLLRWYFRIFVWARLLWHISRVELCLMPSHPDGVGGLGFLSASVYALLPLLLAHGVMLAGLIAGRILHTGAALTDFKVEVAAIVVFLLCLVEGPLLVFSVQLERAKRAGGRDYGRLAERYVREFDRKWIRGGAPAGEPLIGTADIQSLADIGNSMQVVQSMRVVLLSKDTILLLAGAVFAPLLPLVVTIMPMDELARKLVAVLF